jgi:hypothetical protein
MRVRNKIIPNRANSSFSDRQSFSSNRKGIKKDILAVAFYNFTEGVFRRNSLDKL